jgi:hypothetical protein
VRNFSFALLRGTCFAGSLPPEDPLMNQREDKAVINHRTPKNLDCDNLLSL